MYKSTKTEREELVSVYNYNPEIIDLLDAESDNARRGIPISLSTAMAVCDYQSDLQVIRKSLKRWWQFWE